jgi:hypothetical protein
MAQRIIVALVYAVGGLIAVLQGTGVPTTPEAWIGFVLAFVMGFWGKFSSSQTIVAMNRPAWTDEQRKQEALDALNK